MIAYKQRGPIRELVCDLWSEGVMSRVVSICVLAAIILPTVALVVLPILVVYEHRTRERLISDGCEVVDEESRQSIRPQSAGKSVIMVPRTITTETWECPDGRTVETER